MLLYINNNYGQPKDFASFVYLSQVMQAEGIELAATHLRASMPQSMGSMYWQINDVWLGVRASIDYFWPVEAVNYRETLLCAGHRQPCKDAVTTINLISDEGAPRIFDYRLKVMDLDGKVLSQTTRSVTVAARTSLKLDAFSDADLLKGAAPAQTYVVVDLLDKGTRVSRSIAYFVPSKGIGAARSGRSARTRRRCRGYVLT